MKLEYMEVLKSQFLGSTINTDASYSEVPILTITPAPPGGISAKAICMLGGHGFINDIMITDPGYKYSSAPTITALAGTVTTGQVQTFTVTINKDRQSIFTWDLENAIEINENAVIQVVDRVFMDTTNFVTNANFYI